MPQKRHQETPQPSRCAVLVMPFATSAADEVSLFCRSADEPAQIGVICRLLNRHTACSALPLDSKRSTEPLSCPKHGKWTATDGVWQALQGAGARRRFWSSLGFSATKSSDYPSAKDPTLAWTARAWGNDLYASQNRMPQIDSTARAGPNTNRDGHMPRTTGEVHLPAKAEQKAVHKALR